MADSANPIHGKRLKPPSPLPPPPVRAWSMDDIVVALFALLGIGGAVFLPLRFSGFSPTITSFLLATGLAALTYRYLGGIQGASFSVGALKLSGALAALVGIAMLIHHTMINDPLPQQSQTWQVSGQVTDESGQPVAQLLDQSDFAIYPPLMEPTPDGKFKLSIYSQPDGFGNLTFPTLRVAHPNYLPTNLDLNQIPKTSGSRNIVLPPIMLHPEPGPLNPQQPLQQISEAKPAPPAQ